MAEIANSSKSRRPRWFRFSLRMLLVVVTVLCIWLGFTVNSARRQREAIAVILKAGGGMITYYDEMIPVPGSPNHLQHYTANPLLRGNALSRILSGPTSALPPPQVPQPNGPEWLRHLCGDEYFRDVYQVGLNGVLAESDVPKLAGLREIRKLYWSGHIKMPAFDGIRALRDCDLAVLANFSQLQDLSLASPEINGAGLAAIVHLHQLEKVDVSGAVLNDDAMEYIGQLTGLKGLQLNCNSLTTIGLGRLQNLTVLESLSLIGAGVSDTALPYLKKLTKLKTVTVRDTSLTSEAFDELKLALPNTQIVGR